VCVGAERWNVGPATTATNGTVVIPKINKVEDYVASAQTADGQLMIVDLRPANVAFSQTRSVQGEMLLDRTVVGIGSEHYRTMKTSTTVLQIHLGYCRFHSHQRSTLHRPQVSPWSGFSGRYYYS
jgi:hypothetical protein